MADTKISALTGATTPLDGTEVLPIVQSGTTKQVSVANLTAGRSVSADSVFQSTNYTTTRAASPPTYGGNYYIYSGSGLNNAVGGIEWQYATAGSGYGFKINGDGGTDSLMIGYRVSSATWTVGWKFKNTGDLTVDVGNLVIGTSGKGIDFSATGQAAGMTSELLDDYEEGTWTPTFEGTSGSAGAVAYTSSGDYIKVGRQVTLRFTISVTNLGSWTGNARIGGLPFNSAAGNDAIGAGYSNAVTYTGTLLFATAGSSSIGLVQTSSGSASNIAVSSVATTGFIYASLTYISN